MPFPARTAHEAFRAFQDHVNGILNKVLTHYRLEFFLPTRDQATLAFFRRRVMVAVPLPPSPWHLYCGLKLKAVPEEEGYVLHVLKYAYRIQRSASIQDEAEVRFEYVSRYKDSEARWCRHHVQFHRDYHRVREGFSPFKLHIPTGWVTIENVIRFLISDLEVRPLIEDWDATLRESERQSREWTQWGEME